MQIEQFLSEHKQRLAQSFQNKNNFISMRLLADWQEAFVCACLLVCPGGHPQILALEAMLP